MESISRQLFEQSQCLQQPLINQSLNWTLAHNYHLTLCFLGDIQTKDIERLDRIVQSVAHSCSPTIIELSATQWFPNAVKPKALAITPSTNSELETIQTQLRGDLRRAGFHVEGNKFRPHVTLARCKGQDHGQAIVQQPSALNYTMDELVLYSSQLTANGPIYRPVFSHPLGY